MKSLFLYVICPLVFAASALAADYKDFSLFNESPTGFEYDLDTNSFLVDSLIIFERGYSELWKATGVQAVHMQGEIQALAQDGIIHLINNACGGFVAPKGVDSVFYKDNLLVASAGEYNYFYYLSECARYRQGMRHGFNMAVDDPLVCEAGFNTRTITNAHSGKIIYRDNPQNMNAAIYAGNRSCYFIDTMGKIDRFDGKEMMSVSYVDAFVGVTTTDSGFSGFSGSEYFNMTIMQTGNLFDFESLPSSGNCFLADGSRSIFCEAYFEKSFSEKAGTAESVMIGGENIYILSDGVLYAYSKNIDWVKSFKLFYKEPSVCMDDVGLYFTGVVGEVYYFAPGDYWPQEVDAVPAKCSPAGFYRDGAVFDKTGDFVWRYAELIRQNGEKLIYKHVWADRIYYISKVGE